MPWSFHITGQRSCRKTESGHWFPSLFLLYQQLHWFKMVRWHVIYMYRSISIVHKIYFFSLENTYIKNLLLVITETQINSLSSCKEHLLQAFYGSVKKKIRSVPRCIKVSCYIKKVRNDKHDRVMAMCHLVSLYNTHKIHVILYSIVLYQWC